jgi:hypothetical protein
LATPERAVTERAVTERAVTLCVYGEGITDIGPADAAPTDVSQGVVVILVHALCGRPASMRIIRPPRPFMQEFKRRGGKLSQSRRVEFAKVEAIAKKARGAVFVLDTEGDTAVLDDLRSGRDACHPEFSMAVGAAHPCIEAWLLCDGAAIKKGCGCELSGKLPDKPEELPAPCQNRQLNPKTELERVCGAKSRDKKFAIASQIRTLKRLRDKCPASFAPFAVEVEQLIKPLFEATAS